jgi:acyl carrier protein
MNRDQVISAIIAILKEKAAVELNHAQLGNKISDDLDSLDQIHLVMDCESRFAVSIPDEKSGAIETYDDLINLLCDAKAIAI